MSDLERLATWLVDNQDKKGTPDFGIVEAGFRELYNPSPLRHLTPPPVDPTQPLPDANPIDRGVFREALDVPTQLVKGAVTGTRFLTDVFGADNPVSQKLSGVEDVLDDLLSAQSKRDQQEVARIMQQAEDKGLGEQIRAGVQALTVAPVDLIANAFGTSAPVILGSLAASIGGAPVAAVGTGLGVLTGVGITKDAAYSAVLEELTNAGVPEDQAKAAAKEAQAYSGDNLDNIAFGGFLGGLAARFGLEKAVFTGSIGRKLGQDISEEAIEEASKRGFIGEATRTAISEAIPEALQGGQEQFTRNIALQREGFDVPTGRGVAAAATLEGAVGAPVGAISGAASRVANLGAMSEKDAFAFLDEQANKIAAVLPTTEPTPEEAAPQEPGVTIEDPSGLTPEQIKAALEVSEFILPQDKNLTAEQLEEEAANLTGIDDRQADYYRQAARILRGSNAETDTQVADLAKAYDLAKDTKTLNEIKTVEEASPDTKASVLEELGRTEEEHNNIVSAAQKAANALNQAKEAARKGLSDFEVTQLMRRPTGSVAPDTGFTDIYEQNDSTPLSEAGLRSVASLLNSARSTDIALADKPTGKKVLSYFTELTEVEGRQRRQETTKSITDGLFDLAYDVATNAKTTEAEITARRANQENVPDADSISKTMGRAKEGLQPQRTKNQQAEIDGAATFLRNNLDPDTVARFDGLVEAIKQRHIEAIIRQARAERVAGRPGPQPKETSERSVGAEARIGDKKPSEVISIEIDKTKAGIAFSPDRQRKREKRATEKVLESMGIKSAPRVGTELRVKFEERLQEQIGKETAAEVPSESIQKTKDKGKNIDPAVVAIAERGNLKATIEEILKTLPKDLRPIVRQMRRLAQNTKIEIAPVEGPFPGKYDTDANTITLDPDRGLNTSVFLHELAHAALARRLNDPNSAETKAFFVFFSQIKDQMGDAYGGTNLDEFVSELVSNSEFQNLLKTIKPPKGDSMWKTIMDSILELFGVTLGKNTNAYKVGITFVDGILSIDPSIEPPPLSKVFFANASPDEAHGKEFDKLDKLDPSEVEKIVDSLPANLKVAAYGFLRLDNLYDLFRKPLSGIKKIIDNVELRQGYQEQAIESANKKYNAMMVVLNKFRAAMRKLGSMAIDARLARVDILDPDFAKNNKLKAKQKKELGRLTSIFNGLPKEVQNVYKVMRKDYDKMYADYKEFYLGSLDKEARARMAKKFDENPPIAGYIPFRRYGEYVLTYVDKNTKQRTVRTFETRKARDREIQALGLTLNSGIQNASDQGTLEPEEAEGATRPRLQVGEYITADSIRKATMSTLVPSGFVADLIDAIKTDGAAKGLDASQIKNLVDTTYNTYLDLFPESSVVQSFRKAQDVPGASEDLVRAYGDTMVKWARSMADTRYNSLISQGFKEVRRQGERANDPNIRAAAQSVVDRQERTLDPTFGTASRISTTGSYLMFMSGNISSGLVNLSSVPLLTFPILAGKFGGPKTSVALTKASKVAILDIMKTEGVPKWATPEYANGRYVELFNGLRDHGQLRHTQVREVLEGARQTTEEYNGLTAKFLNILSIPIERTERYNRATTAITAYDLARADGMTEDAAVEYAIRTVKDVNTSGMASTAPRWMQTDIGRVMFTFKSFIWQSAYVTAKAFVDTIKGSSERSRGQAFRQLAYTFGMSYAIAGAFGLPFFGAISVLTNMINSLLDDDEEPFNLRREMMLIMPEAITKGPLNYATNLEISNRASVANGMLFREDPFEIEKYGYLNSIALQAFGPLGNYVLDAPYKFSLLAQGEFERGFEALAPSWLRNGIKTMRFAQEGARTIDGRPIDTDISTYNLYMQALGFAPANISSLYETRALGKQYEEQVMQARSKLLKRRYLALTTGDTDLFSETEERIFRLDARYPGLISADTLRRSFKSRASQEEEYLAGVRFNRGFFSNLVPLFDRLEDVNYYGAL